jgi:Stress responsive A/B Barrel Domain
VSRFRHVVMFRWEDTVDDEHVAAVVAGLATLPGLIPEIADYRFGVDAGVNEGNYDFVVVADFGSVDDYLVYRDHPDHRALIADLVTGHVATRAAVQYVIDG